MSTPYPPSPADPADEPPAAELSFRTMVDRVGAIVWESYPGRGHGEADFTFVSEASEALLGYPPQRWLDDPRFWFEITHPADRERVIELSLTAAREGRDVDYEYRAVTADGRVVWLRNIVAVEKEGSGPPRMRGVVVDVTARKVAEDRLNRLHQLTGALAELMSARDVASIVATEGRAAVGAAAVAVFLKVSEDELEIAGYEGYSDEATEEFCRIPLSSPVPAAEVVREGTVLQLTAEEVEERYPNPEHWRRLAGEGPFIALPLFADGRVLGSLAIRMPGGRNVDEPDRVVLDVLARASAQALWRAEHIAAERTARRSAEEANALLDTVIQTAPEGFALFDRELRFVRINDALAKINGVPPDEHMGKTLDEVVPDVPREGHEVPLRQVLKTGRPVIDLEVTGRTSADPHRERTWLCSYYPVFDADGEVAWLGALISDISGRKAAEERAELLAGLGAMLEEVVEVGDRLQRLVDALVPAVADMCTVSLMNDDGSVERAAVKHIDPHAEQLLRAIAPADSTRIAEGDGVVVFENVTEDVLQAIAMSPQEVHVRRRIGMRSGVFAPLIVSGRRIGTLKLGSLRPSGFRSEEVTLAQEVGRRAAVAVDNARLFASERAARERTARLHAVTAALSEALTSEEVAKTILAEVVPAVGAGDGLVWRLAEDEISLEALAWRGYPDALMAQWPSVSLRQRTPSTDAVRDRRSVVLETPEEIDAAYPKLEALRHANVQAVVALPLESGGRTLGAIACSFRTPHRFRSEELALLDALAAQCAQALERARLFEAERRVSVTLQRSLLPGRLPDVPGIEIAVRYLPAAGLEAGGDFYEALPLSGGSVGIGVGDIVGRGATAAAAMGQVRSALRAFALDGALPIDVLRRLSAFAMTVEGGLAATAIYAKLNPVRGELYYGCAGHPWPLLVGPDGKAEYLQEGRGVPLGCLPDPAYEEAFVSLEPGSTLLLYTDGLTERRGTDTAETFERLRQAMTGTNDQELESLLDAVVGEVGADDPLDDVALLAVRLSPTRAGVQQLRYPAEPGRVPEARAALREWLADVGVPADEAADVLLACGEAFANAVEHAWSGHERGHVELELELPDTDQIAITVRDAGRWREPRVTPHRGRGIGLMRALMDGVEIEHGEYGTVVRLRKRFGESGPSKGSPAVALDQGCTVEIDASDDVQIAHLLGDLDLASAATVEGQLMSAADGRALVLDLTGVRFLDSAGARTLVLIAERLGRRVAVVAPPGSEPRRALELSGLGGVLSLRDAL